MNKFLSRRVALLLVSCLLQESFGAVIPAEAGIQSIFWTPAFAGVTTNEIASQALAERFISQWRNPQSENAARVNAFRTVRQLLSAVPRAAWLSFIQWTYAHAHQIQAHLDLLAASMIGHPGAVFLGAMSPFLPGEQPSAGTQTISPQVIQERMTAVHKYYDSATGYARGQVDGREIATPRSQGSITAFGHFVATPLSRLERIFSVIPMEGKTLFSLGSGQGPELAAAVAHGAQRAVGVEGDPDLVEENMTIRRLLANEPGWNQGLTDRIEIYQGDFFEPNVRLGNADMIIYLQSGSRRERQLEGKLVAQLKEGALVVIPNEPRGQGSIFETLTRVNIPGLPEGVGVYQNIQAKHVHETVNPETPFIRMDVGLWSEAYSARTVIAEMRAAGLETRVLINASDTFPDDAELTRIRALFLDVPGIRIARTSDVTNAEMAAPLKVRFNSKFGKARFRAGWWDLPTERLKTWTGQIPAADVNQLRTDLAIAPGEKVFVIGSASRQEADDVMSLIRGIGRAKSPVRILLVPREVGYSKFWQRKAAHSGFQMDIREIGPDKKPHMKTVPKHSIVLFDTEGELRTAYALARRAIIGNTFREGGPGHNVMEPVVQGAFVFFGSHVDQNKALADYVVRKGAGMRLARMWDAIPVIIDCIDNDVAMEEFQRRSAEASAGLRDEFVVPALATFIVQIKENEERLKSIKGKGAAPEPGTFPLLIPLGFMAMPHSAYALLIPWLISHLSGLGLLAGGLVIVMAIIKAAHHVYSNEMWRQRLRFFAADA